MKARNSMSDILRLDYNVYLEPVLATAAAGVAKDIGCMTRSKYIRYALINQLIRDGYPLKKVSNKFNAFVDRCLDKGITVSE